MTEAPAKATQPCGSCPYRKDVPSGVWAAEEYDKLPLYDGETWEQDTKLFMCHQNNGCLCGGWLACHGPEELLAIRIGLSIETVHPSVLDYTTKIPVFSSGAEAQQHGQKEIDNPSPRARQTVAKLEKRRSKQEKPNV